MRDAFASRVAQRVAQLQLRTEEAEAEQALEELLVIVTVAHGGIPLATEASCGAALHVDTEEERVRSLRSLSIHHGTVTERRVLGCQPPKGSYSVGTARSGDWVSSYLDQRSSEEGARSLAMLLSVVRLRTWNHCQR